MKVHWYQKAVSKRGEFAGREEFVSVFECERVGLQRLAFLLTGNSGTVKRCLTQALRECIAGGSVSKEWILNWTRRTVIRNAISLVMCPEVESLARMDEDVGNGLIASSQDDLPSSVAEIESILGLPELDRFVLVICVLEHYSVYDCALLLGKSAQDVVEARQRVANQR